MRRYLCAHFALIVGAALVPLTAAAETDGTAGQALFIEDSDGDDGSGDILKEFESDVELVQFASNLGGGGGLNLANAGRRGQFFVGGEFLAVRANFSQATAFVTTDLTTTPPSFTYNEFDFGYDGSFRVYGGYRDVCCGCEVRFTYSNFNSDGSFQSPENPADGSMTFNSPGEVITGGPGDSVSGDASVDINDYDLGFSRTIPLGSPLGCGCDGGCGDSCCGDSCCGGNWCPAWDVTWTGAVRIADVESQLNYASNIVSTAGATGGLLGRTATSIVDFQGFGLRTGLLGRRYFGRQGIASLYLKGDISLLLGEVEYTTFGTALAQHSITSTQVVPVTELEIGGSVFLTNNFSVTGGYFLAAWHDLGNRAEYDFGALGVQLESFDDANLLTLDGWFLRGEYTF